MVVKMRNFLVTLAIFANTLLVVVAIIYFLSSVIHFLLPNIPIWICTLLGLGIYTIYNVLLICAICHDNYS